MIGPLISAQDVCEAVEATLIAWLPSVSAEIALAGGPTLPLPTTYDMPSAEALISGSAELPAVVVSSPGIIGVPERDEDMAYRATWAVIVSVFARGEDYRETAAQVRGFALACRVALAQHPSLGGFAAELLWAGEEYDALDARAARTLGAGYVTFNVTVDSVTDADAGPLIPPVAPASLITTGVQALTTALTVEEMA